MLKLNIGDGAVVCDLCGKMINYDAEIFDICDDCAKESPIVDNFDRVADLLDFDKKGTFYWVQIIKRRKDNPGMHGDYRCFGDYCIYSYEDLLKYKDEMVKTSKTHNARIVLWVNRRNVQELALPIAQLSLEFIQSQSFEAFHDIFAHVCGKHHQKGIDSLYIVDIDTKDPTYLNKIAELVVKSAATNETFRFEKLIPTIHGYHIICTGFNINLFKQLCVMYHIECPDIHKDNPTVLYFCPQ